MTHKEENWFKKHADTFAVLTAIFGSFLWMTGKFNEMEKNISDIHTDMAVVKTVLIMKDMMPKELAKFEVKE